MEHLIPSSTLPGSELSRRFEGKDHGVEVSLFLVDATPGRGPKLHRHPYEEVFVVRAGEATFTVDQAELDAGAGDVVIAPAQTPHRFVNSGTDRLQLTAIHRSPEFITEWLE
jgi:mannose-6-phosphate isomerase-like protein (cupin superfamily)